MYVCLWAYVWPTKNGLYLSIYHTFSHQNTWACSSHYCTHMYVISYQFQDHEPTHTFSPIRFHPYVSTHTFSPIRFYPYFFTHTFPPIRFHPYVSTHTFSPIRFHPYVFTHTLHHMSIHTPIPNTIVAEMLGTWSLRFKLGEWMILKHFAHMRMCSIPYGYALFPKLLDCNQNFIGMLLMMSLAFPCVWFSNWMHGWVGKQGSVL